MSQPIAFAILCEDLEVALELGSAISRHPNIKLVASVTDKTAKTAEVARLRPTAVIVVIGSQPEESLGLVKQIAADSPETIIIGAARDLSSDLIISSLHVGAKEFLRLPVIASELQAVVDRLTELATKRTPKSVNKGRVIAVFSNKGGCGTSFIASNLAVALASRTCLLDLDLQSGSIGFFFGIEPKFSITDLVENRTRMDDELLAKYLAPYSETVSVLPAPAEVDGALDITPEDVVDVLSMLRERHEYVVIDLAHNFDAITLAALDQADAILLVLNLDVLTVRNALRAISTFDRLDYPRQKVHAIVNRWTKNDLDIGRRQLEQLLGQKSITLVPNDYRSVVNSINVGKPIVESRPSSSISTELKRLAATLTGKPVEKSKLSVAPINAKKVEEEVERKEMKDTEAPKVRRLENGDRIPTGTRTWIRSLFKPAESN